MSPIVEIRLHSADGRTREVPLDKPELILGRATTADLAFPQDNGLSRQHLSIENKNGGWWLRDLGSKNGTMLNGRKIEAAVRLKPGDRIVAGQQMLDVGPAGGSGPAAGATMIFVDEASTGMSTGGAIATGLAEVLRADPNRHVRALIKAGRELSSQRPLEELFGLILNLALEAVSAARGVLATIENGELIIRAHAGDDFRISTTVRDRVLTGRESLLIRDAQLDPNLREQASIVLQNVHSLLAVPLQTDNRVLGLIYADASRREFTREDLNLLTVLANVAAIRLEHARLAQIEVAERMLNHELQQATQIQQGLLPTTAPLVAGVDLAGASVACRGVGGDYFDFLPFADGRVGLVVGDVAGKGMAAALLMSSLQARVQILFTEASDLAPALTRLNQAVCLSCPGNRFITFFAAILDPATGELAYANAGHNPPLVVRADGTVERLDTPGMVLGVLKQGRYESARTQLAAGDVLVLYSDGVTEAVNSAGDEFDEPRLESTVLAQRSLGAGELVSAIHEAVADFAAGAPAADDITVLVAKRV